MDWFVLLLAMIFSFVGGYMYCLYTVVNCSPEGFENLFVLWKKTRARKMK